MHYLSISIHFKLSIMSNNRTTGLHTEHKCKKKIKQTEKSSLNKFEY